MFPSTAVKLLSRVAHWAALRRTDFIMYISASVCVDHTEEAYSNFKSCLCTLMFLLLRNPGIG